MHKAAIVKISYFSCIKFNGTKVKLLLFLILIAMHLFLEMGFTMHLQNQLTYINKVVQTLSNDEDSSKHIILMIDEVVPLYENESDDNFDLYPLDLSRSNIDLLIAINPGSHGCKSFNGCFKIIPPEQHPNTLAKQLYGKHRNNYETAIFVDHMLHYLANYSYLDSSTDLPLDPEKLPPGRKPLWLQRGVNVSDQAVLDFIKKELVSDHETVTLVHKPVKFSIEIKIDEICKQNGWRSMNNMDIIGSEDQVVIHFDIDFGLEHITRAKKAFIIVTTKG